MGGEKRGRRVERSDGTLRFKQKLLDLCRLVFGVAMEEPINSYADASTESVRQPCASSCSPDSSGV
jgi:hypothetical protein